MAVEKKVEIDLDSFSLDAVKRAAYRCSNRFSFDVSVAGHTAACTLTFDGQSTADQVDQAVAAFRREILDQDLRQAIRVETENIRNLILAHAFSRTGLIQQDESIQDD